VVANFLFKVTIHLAIQNKPSLDKKGTKDLVCLAWQRFCTTIEGQYTFSHGTSIQTKLKNQTHVTVQLIEATGSYSVRCNGQNSADRNVR